MPVLSCPVLHVFLSWQVASCRTCIAATRLTDHTSATSARPPSCCLSTCSSTPAPPTGPAATCAPSATRALAARSSCACTVLAAGAPGARKREWRRASWKEWTLGVTVHWEREKSRRRRRMNRRRSWRRTEDNFFSRMCVVVFFYRLAPVTWLCVSQFAEHSSRPECPSVTWRSFTGCD